MAFDIRKIFPGIFTKPEDNGNLDVNKRDWRIYMLSRFRKVEIIIVLGILADFFEIQVSDIAALLQTLGVL